MFLILFVSLLCPSHQPDLRPTHSPSLRPPSYWSSPCSQAPAEHAALMRQAEKEKYTVSRVEFIGNEHIRDHVLRRRVLLNEGDLFKRSRLMGSITNLNRVQSIKRVRLGDIKIRLNRESKFVDMLICFRERHPKA